MKKIEGIKLDVHNSIERIMVVEQKTCDIELDLMGGKTKSCRIN